MGILYENGSSHWWIESVMGFFDQSSLSTKSAPSLIPLCGVCGLFRKCKSLKMPVDGNGKRKILICGEAPGFNEDQQGKPFVGQSGQLLQSTLAKFDVDLREDCWIYNSIICRPTNSEGKNRTPSDAEIGYCRPNVIRTIKELQPNVIILLGGSAVKSVIGWLWKEDVGLISRWDGWKIPSQMVNSWVCPTWHPASLLHNDYGSYQGKNDRSENEVRKLLFERHLKAACRLENKPWREVPDYRSRVQKIIDVEKVPGLIDGVIEEGLPTAFDYETNMIKPDSMGYKVAQEFSQHFKDVTAPLPTMARIICCSVSNGKSTFAYPWHGKAIPATKRLLESNLPKISSNLKFEARWSKQAFGIDVKNWAFDTMIASHVLDSRPGITSIKFQAFVNLGVDSWDGHIKPFLTSNGTNTPNRINEVNLNDLLEYCALDSLYELLVAKRQAKKLGIDLSR